MKKFLLSFFILTLFTSYSLAQSQMLYGLASSGGIGGNQGTLYKMNSNGTGFTVIHNFQSPDGWLPMGNVIQASNGKLYGCCHEGAIGPVAPFGVSIVLPIPTKTFGILT
jgi:uncharacterized repeat protein (TIGR03803 family)